MTPRPIRVNVPLGMHEIDIKGKMANIDGYEFSNVKYIGQRKNGNIVILMESGLCMELKD